jgi:hypothetical protein
MIKFSATLVTVSFAMLACSLPTPDKTRFDASTAEDSIRTLLRKQEIAWNNGSVEEFMEGYWKSDSLRFVGSTVTKGWQATLDRYKKVIPTAPPWVSFVSSSTGSILSPQTPAW